MSEAPRQPEITLTPQELEAIVERAVERAVDRVIASHTGVLTRAVKDADVKNHVRARERRALDCTR